MKNRLQFNRHFPIFSGTTQIDGREQANAWLDSKIKSADFIPLIGEPIVLRYLDKDGNKQLILAVGKATGNTAGDTTRREYHVIDTALLDEKIAAEVIARTETDQNLQDQINELVGMEVIGQDAIKVVTVDGDSTISLLINENDKVLTQDDNGLKANISIDYVSEDKRIYLKGANNTVIGEVDTTDFVRDGMLDSVIVFVATEEDHREHPELVVGETYLRLTFNTESGKEDVFVSVKDLVDIYTVSATSLNYLTIEGYQIRANVDVENGLASKNSVDHVSAVTDTIIKAAGLNQGNEGEYPTHDETHYIKNATSLDNADVLLDSALYTLSGVVGDLGDVSEVEAKLNELSAATQDAVRNINSNIDDLEDDVRDLTTGLTSVQNRVTNVETGLTQLTTTVTDNTNKINSLSAGTVSGLNNLTDGLNTTNTNLNNLSGDVNNLSGAVVSNENKINALSASVVTNKEDIAELSAATISEVNRLFEDITGVSDDLDTLSGATMVEIATLKNDVVDLDNRIDEVSGLTDGTLTINLNGEPQGIYSPSADTVLNLTAITEVTGADVLLTGYEIATGHSAVVAADNVNEAVGKLEYRLVEIENNTGSPVAQIAILSGVVGEFSATTDGEINRLDGKIDELSGMTPVDVVYNSTAKTIYLVNNDGQIGTGIDATAFIKDGMVSSVTITGGNMVITFNTDAGHEDITLALTDIFDPNNYYNKTDIDNGLSAATVAHIENTDVHVTTANKKEWSDGVISAASAWSMVVELSGAVQDSEAAINGLDGKIETVSGNVITYVDGKIDEVYASSVTYTDSAITVAINNLDSTGATSDVNHYLTSVTITDGLISAVGEAQIPNVPNITIVSAGTGNVVASMTANGHEITYQTATVATSEAIDGLSGAVITLSAETISEFSSAFTAINNLSAATDGKITVINNEISDINDDIAILYASAASLDNKIDTLATDAATSANTLNDKINTLATDAATSANTLDGKIDTLAIDAAASANTLNTKINTVSGDVIELSASVVANETAIANLSGSYVTLSASVVTGVSVNGGNVITPVNGVVSFEISGQTLDNFFDAVEYDTNSKRLNFYNGGTSTAPIDYVDVTEFAGVYSSGNGIDISDDDEISIKLANKGDVNYLGLDADGLYLSGITAMAGDVTNLFNDLSSVSGDVINLSGAVIDLSGAVMANETNIGDLSAATVAHIESATSHVSDTDRTTWNNKQDAITNLQAIIDNAASGALAYTMVGELSAGTLQLSADTRAAIDDVYASANNYTDAAIAAIPAPEYPSLTSAVTGNGNVFNTILVDGHKITMGKDFTAATSADVTTLSGAVVANETNITTLSGAMVDNEFVVATSLNDLNVRVLDNADRISSINNWAASAITDTMINNWNANGTDISALSSATVAHIDSAASHVSAADRTFWTNGSNSGGSAYTMVNDLSASVIEKAYVTAEALNDLNTRLLDAETVEKTIGQATVSNGSVEILYDFNILTINGNTTLTVDYNANLIPTDGHVKVVYISVEGSGQVTFNVTGTGKTAKDAGGMTNVTPGKVVKLFIGTVGSTTYFYFAS